MQAMDDMTLLREYASRHSEAAFEALVARYVHLVHSAALRQLRDPHLAEEVTQAVFIILARKAGRISNLAILSGWLFKTTRFVALAQSRTAARRRQYELQSNMQGEVPPNPPDPLWEQIAPLLDEALMQLGEKDRQAVLLRYFEDKSLAAVGNSLNTGEDAARMRINRALEKLHARFSGTRALFSQAFGPWRFNTTRPPDMITSGAGTRKNESIIWLSQPRRASRDALPCVKGKRHFSREGR
jgi:RNA polymerase sigma factor (sigma-70 family)